MGLHSEETHHFVQLLTGHQASLRAFIVSLIPGSDDVQDVLQDTNVVLWEKMAEYKQGTNFNAWAFAIARNMVKVQLRKTKRNQSPALREDIIHAISDTWYQRAPETTTRKQLALEQCLKTLSASERDLVSARYNSEKSLSTYSDITGRPAQSLRVSLFRIRAKLRECVKKRLPMEGDTR